MKQERRNISKKDAFERLIRTAEKARHMDNEMAKIGYANSLYADIFGDIADAIYKLLGENTRTFESSFTYVLLNTDVLTTESKATLMADRFQQKLSVA